jgi:glycosyltransferase involved in cell wall biosynthesis
LEAQGFATRPIVLNDSSFDHWLADLRPDCVVFDRLMTEEQFGARVWEVHPQAVQVLDTVDLRFVRELREQHGAEPPWQGEGLLRELAAIHRCDLTWVVSDFEERLLTQTLGVPAEKVVLSRFSPEVQLEPRPFAERRHFVSIGNFRHRPNWDSVLWLHREIWPKVRARLPLAEVHLYGAYPPKEASALHSPERGFYFHGPVESAVSTLAQYRVNLAPLRFGAGIKTKVIDGWASGTPCVGTPIAVEGMCAGLPWGGLQTQGYDPSEFAARMVELHEQPTLWEEASQRAQRLLSEQYSAGPIEQDIRESLRRCAEEQEARRARQYVGQLLRMAQHKATLYFSRWLELKERANRGP